MAKSTHKEPKSECCDEVMMHTVVKKQHYYKCIECGKLTKPKSPPRSEGFYLGDIYIKRPQDS